MFLEKTLVNMKFFQTDHVLRSCVMFVAMGYYDVQTITFKSRAYNITIGPIM